MTSIYILKLKNNKYYIGQSKTPEYRIRQHKKGLGAYWTKLHPPVKVINVIRDCDSYDEDKYTLQYMADHGIDNVRGGSFCQRDLPKESIKTIKRMINGAKNKCQNCDKAGHYINKCPTKNKKSKSCSRCGRNNHTDDKCYAKTYSTGESITSSEDECEDECEDNYEESNMLSQVWTWAASIVSSVAHAQLDVCDRCGRSNHVELDCYATKHIKGYYLKK
jgi:hypothetical protein